MSSPPVFHKALQDLSTTEGECLVLECRVTGDPLPNVIWRREGHVITDSPDFRMLHKGDIATLVIGEAFPEDSGRFSCEASNKAGIASTSSKIVVKEAKGYSVSTKAPLSNRETFSRSSLEENGRTCNITSLVTSSIASAKPPSSNNPKHISCCHIIPVKPYRRVSSPVVATSDVASSISYSQATVTSSVTSSCHQSSFSSMSYCERSITSSTPSSSTSMTTKSKQVRSGSHSDENHNLMVNTSEIKSKAKKMIVKQKPNKQEGKRRGDYVVYSPEYGITESRPQKYKVSSFEQRLMNEIEYRLEQIPPINEDPEDGVFEKVPMAQQINPIFVSPLKNFKTGEGSACTFECRISAKPVAKVYWFKDGKQISKRSRHYLQKSDTKGRYELQIPNPSLDDDGNYTAVACNPQGRVSSTGRLAVFYERQPTPRGNPMSPTDIVMVASFSNKDEHEADEESAQRNYRPAFLQKPPSHTTSEEGKLVRFDVKVSGLPTPNLEWFINGKPVKQDSLHKILVRESNVHSFLLERVSPMDEGQYTIKASNKAGFVVAHCQLHVKPREHTTVPTFIQRLVGQCVAEGDSVRLEARVVGTPYPKICWKKGADQVLPDKRTHLFEGDNGYVCLQLAHAQLQDAGWYSCNAANTAGIASCNCKLYVYCPVSSDPAERVRIRTPHRYENLARVAGIDVRESFTPEAYVHSYLPESEEL